MSTEKEGKILERRYFRSDLEVRADGEIADNRMIDGYGAVFNSYTDMGWFIEVVDPGFFTDADFSQCACLHNHLEHLVLGRTKNNTLSVSVDMQGLKYTCNVAKTAAGNDLLELIRRGDVDQSSFAFTVRQVNWEEVDISLLAGKVDDAVLDRLAYAGKVDVRRLMRAGTIYDVSPVTFPAYADTAVAMSEYRSWHGQKKEQNSPPAKGGGLQEYRARQLLLQEREVTIL